VGARIARSYRCTKRVYTEATDISKSTTRSNTHSVCFGNAHWSEQSPCTRKRDIERGQNVIAPSPNIFHFWSSVRFNEVLLRDGKDMLCCGHERKEASALFQAHIVRVLTIQKLNKIFRNHDSSGRIGKWVMELSELVIDFEKRSVAKSQVLTDFIADWMEPSSYTEGTIIDTPQKV
jgi:hypothetical protein